MIELPGTLAPWAAELSLLSTDLALALAPWIGRIALAVGPISDIRTQKAHEPDGYAGLARRGSYERLVTAEWALAELFPDEFLRRAAAGEHLFLDLLRRGPRGALRSVVVVSAGPDQIGAPRLVHLAALIVFARRAAAAGAGFSWGVLEAPEQGLSSGFDTAAVRRLLDARTTVLAGEPAVAAWRTALGPRRDEDLPDARGGEGQGSTAGRGQVVGLAGERPRTGSRGSSPPERAEIDWWLVGAAATAPWARRAGAACVAVRDVIAPGARTVEVEVHRRGAPATLRLDLPPPDHCARLLRDPLATGRGTRVARAAGKVRRIRFATAARRLLVELEGGVVQSWPVPSSPSETLGSPRRWEAPYGERLVALGGHRRSVLAMTVATRDTAVRVYFGDTQRGAQVTVPETIARALAEQVQRDQLTVGECGVLKVRQGRGPELVCLLAGRVVVVPDLRFPMGNQTVTAATLGDDDGDDFTVIGLALHNDVAVWGSAKPGGALIVRHAGEAGPKIGAYSFWGADTPHPGEQPLMFGFRTQQQHEWGPVAARVNGRDWRLDGAGIHHQRLICATRVHGVALLDGTPSLLTQIDDRRLGWMTRDGVEALPAASAPIVAAAICTARPNVAWVTATGEVSVYSQSHKALVMRLTPGATKGTTP